MAVRIEMKDGFNIPYHDGAILALVKQVVRYTERAAISEKNIKPNHFILNIDSQLLDSSIFLHLRSTSDAACREILTEFERVDQSNRAKGRKSIFEDAFIIDCNAIEAKRKAPVGKKRNHPGGGCRRQKRLQKQLKIKYNVHAGAFWEDIPVISTTLCLFHAIIMSCAHALMTTPNFYNFKSRPNAQKKMLNRVLKWCQINRKHRMYAIEDYGDIVQVL